MTNAQAIPWWEGKQITDSFHGIYLLQTQAQLVAYRNQFQIEGMPNTVTILPDIRPWMQYPSFWNNMQQEIQLVSSAGMPIGSVFGWGPSDCADTPASQACGFLSYYQQFVSPQWTYPNGTLAAEPYGSSVSRSFTGDYSFRILGQEFGRRDMLPSMQPQDPYWLSFLTSWAEHTIDIGAASVSLDSSGSVFPFFASAGWGCSGTWEGDGFISYLKSHYTSSQLQSMGVADVDTFCMKEYITAHFGVAAINGNYEVARGAYPYSWPIEQVQLQNPGGLMKDPLVKAFVVYNYVSFLSFVAQLTELVNGYASSQGKQVLLTSNQFQTWVPEGSNGVDGIIVAPYFQVMDVERNDQWLPPYQGNAAVCKTGLAEGGYSKPVWIYNGDGTLWDFNPYNLPSPPQNVSTLLETRIAESYASGCIRLIPVNAGTVQEGWPQHRLINGSERDAIGNYYSWIADNSQAFTGTQNVARVAILYSIPDVVWNWWPTFGLDSHVYDGELNGWARALEMSHIPYDIVLTGMNGVYEPQPLQSLLGKYDVMIAPMTEHLSEADFKALQAFVANGGKLITTSDFGQSDDLNNPRGASETTQLLSDPNTVTVQKDLGYNFEKALENNQFDQALLFPMASRLLATVPQGDRIQTDAPYEVLEGILSQTATHGYVIQLVNYDYQYNAASDSTVPQAFSLNYTLPPLYSHWQVRVTSPDVPGGNISSFMLQGDQLSLKIANLKVWDVITVVPVQQAQTTTTTAYQTATLLSTTTVTSAVVIPGTTSTEYITKLVTSVQNSTTTTSSQGPGVTPTNALLLAAGAVMGAAIALIAVRRWRFLPKPREARLAGHTHPGNV